MYSKKATVNNKIGVHGFLATELTNLASKFPEKVEISAKGDTVNAKSLLFVLSLGINEGDTVTFKSDNKNAVKELACFVEKY